MAWYRRDKAAVAAALQRGERPDLATTMASGPLDELVALHEELGILAILDEIEVQRTRTGIADELLLRTLATLPFVEQASLSGASEVLFLCLPSSVEVEAVVYTAGGVLEGAHAGLIVVDSTTADPDSTRRISADLAAKARKDVLGLVRGRRRAHHDQQFR